MPNLLQLSRLTACASVFFSVLSLFPLFVTVLLSSLYFHFGFGNYDNYDLFWCYRFNIENILVLFFRYDIRQHEQNLENHCFVLNVAFPVSTDSHLFPTPEVHSVSKTILQPKWDFNGKYEMPFDNLYSPYNGSKKVKKI